MLPVGIEEIISDAVELSEIYGVPKEEILLLRYSKALKRRNYTASEKIYEAVKMSRKPIRLVK